MKLARQLERRLEDALDHLAGRIFRGGLHVSELAARVAREAELAEFRTPAGPGTANHFTLAVNPANLADDPQLIARELEIAFAEVAADRGWRLEGPVEVALDRSTDVGIGTISCAAAVAKGTLPCWAQLTAQGGERTLIRHNRAIVGRSSEADVLVDHPEISRTHALIYRQGGEIYVVDAGSANGTLLDGYAVGRTPTRMAAVAELTLANHPFRFTPCRS